MIIFYEDEPDSVELQIEHLQEEGVTVELFTSAKSLLHFYANNYAAIDLVVIDVMVFGPGNDFDSKVQGGMLSGLILIDRLDLIDIELSQNKVPKKVVYTNRADSSIHRKLSNDARVFEVCEKSFGTYDEFADKLIKIVGNV